MKVEYKRDICELSAISFNKENQFTLKDSNIGRFLTVKHHHSQQKVLKL